MPPKNKTPAPIDRPLSRAYLREFTGWSTAYPPGMSEPTSLRVMENMQIQRDGSCRLRPGLGYLNYATFPPDADTPGVACDQTTPLLGSHESFYNEFGRAYLYAVRELDDTVGFRVFASTEDSTFEIQTLAEAGFDIPQTEAVLNFDAGTTYVRYIQIDNKIFALSNNGETMRMFFVGVDKVAKRLFSITRPEWNVDDKPIVVQPDATWIGNLTPIDTRTNLMPNPTVEKDLRGWEAGNAFTKLTRTNLANQSGLWAIKATSLPTRTNLIPRPLNDVAGATGIADWVEYNDISQISISGSYMRIRVLHTAGNRGYADSPKIAVQPKTKYRVGYTKGTHQNMLKLGMVATYYNSAGHEISSHTVIDNDMGLGGTGARKQSDIFTTPSGCYSMRIGLAGWWDSGVSYFEVKDVYVGLSSEADTTALDGSDGTDFFWTGTTNNSSSVYHPPKNIKVAMKPVTTRNAAYNGSAYVKGDSVVNAFLTLNGYDVVVEGSEGHAGATTLVPTTTVNGSDVPTSTSVWTRLDLQHTFLPVGTSSGRLVVTFRSVARGDAQYVDSALWEKTSALDAYFSGDTPGDTTHKYTWDGDPHFSRSIYREFALPDSNPTPNVPTADTLISDDEDKNTTAFGFFYTFSNEIGESAPSQITVVRTQRDWGSWLWQEPNGAGEPDPTALTNDPLLCADQLVAYIPHEPFDAGVAAGAIAWSLYMFTWAKGATYPTTAVLIDKQKLNTSSEWGSESYLRTTPAQPNISVGAVAVPTASTLFNSSKPSSAGQGIVAADRAVLVFDPMDRAVIRWSSNQQGQYENFSPLIGGGIKTLTSGELMIPATVKLWQNPQSTDTLTILCLGTDGHSTGYYMQPAQIASQSEAVNIMGFEETTATPGTTSPFGCEVLNNALYHPLDEHLLKSVASNYNINHTPMTDLIADKWKQLDPKEHMVSSQHDNRLYYLVNNPEGEPLEDGCWGNEVWVYDAAQKAGSWSRWLVQGQSLRKIRVVGQVVMSLTHPKGIFYFDPQSSVDNYVDDDGNVQTRNISWRIETNIQGANRAHDAWCNLQQADLNVGFFAGNARYGIRGIDVNSKQVNISKKFRSTNPPGIDPPAIQPPGTDDPSSLTWNLEEFLLIRRIMKEWYFYASSIEDVDGVTEHSEGQLSYVQYRYTPVSVNVGYEYGSVETFDYGRNAVDTAEVSFT